MNPGPIVGLAAHVDAGKTTLSEAMLFLSGVLRRQGRVDHGDAFLDTTPMEKDRGITIFSREARLSWNRKSITLVDTPGHTDFSGETERALAVMDAAVLVISAPEGVQSHTLTLWRLLEKAGIPVLLFVNKTDLFQGDPRSLLAILQRELSDRIVPFPDPDPEKLALCDEACLDAFLREGAVSERQIFRLFTGRGVFPCFFGAALKNEGVAPLLDFLADYTPSRPAENEFGALVYKVARDPQGARLTCLKVTGGVLRTRDLLSLKSADAEWAEKAAELRLYSGARYEAVPQVEAGQLCAVVGLSRTRPGDGLGKEKARKNPQLRPCYACRLIPEPGADLHFVLDCLHTIEEEEPLIHSEFIEARREIRIQSMGPVYLEVLHRQLEDRFGLHVSFGETSVLYRETIAAPVEGVGHYEPLRHYAEVHLLLSPLPAGSGLQFDSAVSVDDLALNWQRLILTHLQERVHPGVLTGSPITDMRITLVAGRAHLKHTEGGDFRQATYRAVRQGLMKAQSVLLEPWVTLSLAVPEENIGRVMSDLSQMGASFEPPLAENGFSRLTAAVPASRCGDYARQLAALTRGRGRFSSSFLAYRPCPDAEKVIAQRGYDPLRDTFNPPDSVFCSHGAGVVVPWDQVEAFMHLPSLKEKREQEPAAAPPVSRPAGPARSAEEEEETLRRIFEKTYGPVRSRALVPPSQEAPVLSSRPEAPTGEREILLVDGYNVLFAWEEWKSLLKEHLDTAREQLIDVLCNYAGITGRDIILVFDAYRVRGNPGSAEKNRNIFVIYTRESQTADAFIEQTTYHARGRSRVRVVTSDQPEQLIAAGNEALRTSAREFRREVIQAQGDIAAFLARNNRPGTEKALERAYKEAWKKSHHASSGEALAK